MSDFGIHLIPRIFSGPDNKVLLVLGQRTGAHHEDRTKFYWSWVGGLVLIVRTEQSFTGLGPEDWCSSLGLRQVNFFPQLNSHSNSFIMYFFLFFKLFYFLNV